MSDDVKDKESEDKLPQPDMAQAEQILFYHDAPIGGSASFQEAVQAKSNFAQRIPGTSEWTIGNGVGSLSQLTREEIAQREKEESAEWFEEFADVIDHIHEQERQREEWAQARHSYAGIEMTGEEWGEFAEQLKGDTPLRKWLMEKLKKEGKTDAKANEMADQIALLAKMQSLPKDQWTDEMKALNGKLDADPKLKNELEDNLRKSNEYSSGLEASGQKPEAHAEIAKADTTTSTEAGADILSQVSRAASAALSTPNSFASTLDGPAIASGLDLSVHHKAALAATEPLDAPKQIAAFTPPSGPVPTTPGGGFDV